MKMPDFSAFLKIKEKLEDELGNWLFFMKYRAEVEVMEPQEWMTFRGTLNQYVDLVSEYLAKSKELANLDKVAKLIK